MDFALGILAGSLVTFVWMSWMIHSEHLETIECLERHAEWLRKQVQKQVKHEDNDDWWKS